MCEPKNSQFEIYLDEFFGNLFSYLDEILGMRKWGRSKQNSEKKKKENFFCFQILDEI